MSKRVVKKGVKPKAKPKKVVKQIIETDTETDEEVQSNSLIKKLKLEYPVLDSKLSRETVNMFNEHINNVKISTKIEQGLMKWSYEYCTKKDSVVPTYLAKRQDLIANMDCEKIGNKFFVKRIKDKTLKLGDKDIKDYDEIPYLSPAEMFPEKWSDEINRKIIREEKTKNIATSDLYKCGRCGARKASVAPPVQIRSADEPMTTYITCLVCNYVFRI
jgi:DNA-directed RNA polymerase subunit M/transcription elongation factor TFIIS